MDPNYYVILGVASGATPDEIKSAFRRRAMELHPDHSGLESGPFRQVQEAYGVLSDPERRRSYDRQIQEKAVRRPPWAPSAEPMVPPKSKGEPFRPVEDSPGFREIQLDDSPAEHHPSFEELFDRLWSNFQTITRPKEERVENLLVEVRLSPMEGIMGGTVQVNVPARATCSTCGGQGWIGGYECWRCMGNGHLTGAFPIRVAHPPGIKNEHLVQIPLDRFGIGNFYLTVYFRVSRGE